MATSEKTKRLVLRDLAALFVLMIMVSGISGFFLPQLMDVFAISPPNIISYQGRILNSNGAPVSDASLSMEFRIYDSAAGGTCLWSNSSSDCDSDTPASTVARTVTLTDGLFSENLGDTSLGSPYASISDSVFNDNASLYLEVEIGGEVLTPRKRVVSTGFALNANSLDGLDSTAFLASTGDVATGEYDFTGAEFLGGSPLIFEGATNDGTNLTTFVVSDPSAPRTITFKDESGTVAYLSDIGGTTDLDTAYDNFGATASLINVDAAEGQTGGLEWSIDGASPYIIDLQSTGDFIVQDAGTAFFTFNDDSTVTVLSPETTSDIFEITATGLTTGTALDINVNALTTGQGLRIDSTSPISSGDLAYFEQDATYTGSETMTGQILQINRDVTVTGGTVTNVNADLLRITNSGTEAGGTYTDTASLLDIGQNNASASGEVVRVSNVGSGEAIFISQQASTPGSVGTTGGGALHISNSANSNQGLTVYTSEDAAATSELVRFESDDTAFDEEVLVIQQDGAGDGVFIDQNGSGTGLFVQTDGADSGVYIDQNADGIALELDSNATTANILDIDVFSVATGNIIDIASNSATATAQALNIDFDNGDNNNDVFTLITDETTVSGTGADTVKARITASGEFFSDVGFSAGATTNYYDGSITDNDADADDFFDFNLAAGADSFRILTGNLRVGDAAPDSALNGEDFYVEGGSEFDGPVRFDGSVTHNGPMTFSDEVDFTLTTDGAFSENVTINSTHAIDASNYVFWATMNHSAAASTGTNYVGVFQNENDGGATGTPDGLLLIANSDTNESVQRGLEVIASTGGGITDAIDVSDADITNAIFADANFVLHDGIRVFEGATGTLTWEDTAGNDLMTLTDSGTTGTLNVTGDLTCADCFDFSDFSDSMSLDAATSIAYGSSDLFFNMDGSGSTGFLDGGSGFFTINSNRTLDYVNALSTTDDAIDASSSTLTSGDLFDLDVSTASFTGDILDLNISGASATGRGLFIDNSGTGSSIFVNQDDDTGSTVDATAGGAIHVDNSNNNDYGLTVYSANNGTQNTPLAYFAQTFTSFDQYVVEVESSGTAGALYIDNEGNASTSISDAAGGALHVSNGLTNNYGLTAYSNASVANTALVGFFSDNASFGEQVLFIEQDGSGGGIEIQNDGSGMGLFVDQNANTGSTVSDTAGGALHVSNTGNDNFAFTIYSNNGATQSTPLARLEAENVAFDQDLLFFQNDGVGSSIFVDQDGDTGFGGAIEVENTGNDAYAFIVESSNGATQDTALVRLDVNSAAFDENLFEIENAGIGDALNIGGGNGGNQIDIFNGGTGSSIFIDQNADTGSTVDASAGGALHVDNSGNDDYGLTVYSGNFSSQNTPLVYFRQNITSFDQYVFEVESNGTAGAMYVDNNGNTSTTISDTAGGALHLSNGLTNNYGLTAYSNASVANTSLVGFFADSASFDEAVVFVEQDGSGGGVFIQNDGAGSGLSVDQNADTVSSGSITDTSGGAIHVGNTGNNSVGLSAWTDAGGTATDPLVYFESNNAAFDQDTVNIVNRGTVSALRLDNFGTGSDTLYINNNDTGSSVFVDQSGDTGSTVNSTAGGAVHIVNSLNPDYGFTVYTAAGTSNEPLAYFFNDAAGFDDDTLVVQSDSISTGTAALRINTTAAAGSSGPDSPLTIEANNGNYAVTVFNDGNSTTRDGILVQAGQDLNPSSASDYIVFADGDGDIIGAIEGDGAGGVTNASAGSDYAELFPGTYADFAAGDILGLDSSGNVKLASNESEMIGAFSIAPNTLGNWVNNWETIGTYVPVALLGQVPVNVDVSGGAISAGDYLSLSANPGVAMKQNGPGYTIGVALEDHASGTGQIEVYITPGWHSGGAITRNNGENKFVTDFLFGESGVADAGTQGKASQALTFRGSGWNGASAEDVDMTLYTDVNSSTDYQLSILNDTGTEVAFVNDDGDLALAGRLYPSDQGALQTDKYIYYDSTGSPSMDYMRTNAAGWGVGSYDFAEMFPSLNDVVAGELVVFATGDETIMRSDGTEYDQRVAGIVSTRPGFLAGEFIEGHVPVALAGRVPTYVTTENGAVKPGDPLTTSSTPGYAMKATEPGPIVGYAMESLNEGTGSIIVYVNVSYFDGGPVTDAPAADNSISGVSNVSSLNVSGGLNLNGGIIYSVGSIAGIGNKWVIEEDGDIVTEGRVTQVIRSHQGEDVPTYGVFSPDTTLQLSGTVQLVNGRADIDFREIDPEFSGIISASETYRVLLTANGASNPLYAMNRENTGFTIMESNGSSEVLVDWLVIAYHKDFPPEAVESIPEVPAEDSIEEPVEEEIVQEEDDVEEVSPVEEPEVDAPEEETGEELNEEETAEESAEEPALQEDSPEESALEEPAEEPPVEEMETTTEESSQVE